MSKRHRTQLERVDFFSGKHWPVWNFHILTYFLVPKKRRRFLHLKTFSLDKWDFPQINGMLTNWCLWCLKMRDFQCVFPWIDSRKYRKCFFWNTKSVIWFKSKWFCKNFFVGCISTHRSHIGMNGASRKNRPHLDATLCSDHFISGKCLSRLQKQMSAHHDTFHCFTGKFDHTLVLGFFTTHSLNNPYPITRKIDDWCIQCHAQNRITGELHFLGHIRDLRRCKWRNWWFGRDFRLPWNIR